MDFHKQHVREDLGGSWSFAFGRGRPARDCATLAELSQAGMQIHPCTVPGNFELDLQAVGLLDEPFFGLNMLRVQEFEDCHVWYGRSFEGAPRPGHAAELVFEGLDCLADVYLNGRRIGSTDNMLVEHVFDVTGHLRGSNELLVHIRPAVEAAREFEYPAGVAAFSRHHESLYIRKAPHMYGWDIMPRAVSAGIWRPVHVRHRPGERLEEVYLRTVALKDDSRTAQLRLCAKMRLADAPGGSYELRIQGACGESKFDVRQPVHFPAEECKFDVSQARLWWPRGYGEANLYDVTVSLLRDCAAIDRMTFQHGIRTVELLRTSTTTPEGAGEFCLKVNGTKVFAKGTNWVPADAFHSRDAARLPAILEMVEELECNIIRCWGGNVYENDTFYEWCDRRGVMVWQDFAMACAVYPQDDGFAAALEREAVKIVKRLRQHACLTLWAGDNECDWFWGSMHRGDPNRNRLTRRVLPRVIQTHDPGRPYLPSSPYIDEAAHQAGKELVPENHLWGPRDYYKSDFYRKAVCHFASEIGYHGCPAPDSVRRFISPEKLWPYEGNDEWCLHSTNPSLGRDILPSVEHRVRLMANQIPPLFGAVPDNLDDFAFASQATQAEAFKYFIERFRAGKWRRTGIIWWNLMDGWPQFSDAVVDYYFVRKLAYWFIRASQQHVCLMVREEDDGRRTLVAVNDTLADAPLRYTVTDVDGGAQLAGGEAVAPANQAANLEPLVLEDDAPRMLLIEWTNAAGSGRNHYLAGKPPVDLDKYRAWLRRCGLCPEMT